MNAPAKKATFMLVKNFSCSAVKISRRPDCPFQSWASGSTRKLKIASEK